MEILIKMTTPEKNIVFKSYIGSYMYGANDEMSDFDFIEIHKPPKSEWLFPYYVAGFDDLKQNSRQTINKELNTDVTEHNIIKFIKLCSMSSVNCLEVLFCPSNKIIHMSEEFYPFREKSELFLSKQCYTKFKEFAKNTNKTSQTNNQSRYHSIRLLYQLKDILQNRTMRLDANSTVLKEYKYGHKTYEEYQQHYDNLIYDVDNLYETTKIPEIIDISLVRDLLIRSLY